jgi:hypothetical protein
MPATGLSREEATDVAAYLLRTPLEPSETSPAPRRLPILERKVSYGEVDEKVFRITCRHCHADADVALGDGGPGNTGGFGFQPRKINLSTYAAINAGYLDKAGERQSLFAKLEDGTPFLVATLLARQAEEVGHPSNAVRGMPLGLPSVSPEQVQLVESWIAQGRPR